MKINIWLDTLIVSEKENNLSIYFAPNNVAG